MHVADDNLEVAVEGPVANQNQHNNEILPEADVAPLAFDGIIDDVIMEDAFLEQSDENSSYDSDSVDQEVITILDSDDVVSTETEFLTDDDDGGENLADNMDEISVPSSESLVTPACMMLPASRTVCWDSLEVQSYFSTEAILADDLPSLGPYPLGLSTHGELTTWPLISSHVSNSDFQILSGFARSFGSSARFSLYFPLGARQLTNFLGLGLLLNQVSFDLTGLLQGVPSPGPDPAPFRLLQAFFHLLNGLLHGGLHSSLGPDVIRSPWATDCHLCRPWSPSHGQFLGVGAPGNSPSLSALLNSPDIATVACSLMAPSSSLDSTAFSDPLASSLLNEERTWVSGLPDGGLDFPLHIWENTLNNLKQDLTLQSNRNYFLAPDYETDDTDISDGSKIHSGKKFQAYGKRPLPDEDDVADYQGARPPGSSFCLSFRSDRNLTVLLYQRMGLTYAQCGSIGKVDNVFFDTLLASGKSSATHGFLCAIKGHRVSGGIRAAVAQGTVASSKKILWDSLLRKTMANTKERIDTLEAQIRDMTKSDPDAPGILKQFSLRLDALEVNLEATDNAQYAENMEWEGKFQELQDRDRVELLSRAVVNTPAGGAEHSSRPRVPEPKSYAGARDAKEVENFLFDIEQYFRAIRVNSKATNVSMATMYLKYAEIKDGSCVINTWDIFKRELKSQFFPENAAFNARKALLECKHTGWVREYCQAFSALMLDISDMSAVDRLFMEGLKPRARTELNRRRVNNLNEAIIAAESLSDYNSEPQRPPQRGNPSRSIGGKKPGGQVANQSWGSKSS
ncbi:hypothetical protein RJ639_038868 [Escallonia herrerae]|uniref:Retrotransposon gag domain-containing protein n=1 Tax=Escallonia herrerae TaxID=1293975 RepID=A0AA89B5E4_9ASTE|nr:hypothetical protein RJ639_038868 [Escallonia herrerae]